MPTIPMPQTPDVQRAAYQGAAPADQTAKYRGQAQLAQGIGQVGAAMAQFAEKAKTLKDRADEVNARLRMRQAEADITKELETETDTSKWGAIVERHHEAVVDEVFASEEGSKLSPDLRDRLALEFRDWGQKNRIQVEWQGRRKQTDENVKILTGAAQMAYNAGNDAEGDGYIDMLVSDGHLSEPLAVQARQQGRYHAQTEQAKAAILADPIAAEDMFEKESNWPDLTKSDRLSLKKTAKVEAARERAETVQAIVERKDAGEIVTEAQLDELVDSGHLLPTQKRWLMQQQTALEPGPDLYNRASELEARIGELDINQPDGQMKYWELRQEASLMPSYIRTEMLRQLQEAKDGGDVDPVVRREAAAYVNRLFERNYLGNVQRKSLAQAEKKGGRQGDPADVAGFNQANEKRFNLHTAVDRFLREHPESSPLEVKAFIDGIVSPDRAAAGANGVLNVTGKKTK